MTEAGRSTALPIMVSSNRFHSFAICPLIKYVTSSSKEFLSSSGPPFNSSIILCIYKLVRPGKKWGMHIICHIALFLSKYKWL